MDLIYYICNTYRNGILFARLNARYDRFDIALVHLLLLVNVLFIVMSIVYATSYLQRHNEFKAITYDVELYKSYLNNNTSISMQDIDEINETILNNRKPKNLWVYRNVDVGELETLDYGKTIK